MGIQEFANKLNSVIINPLLALMFAVGLVVFVWGVVEFMAGLNGVGEGSSKGKQHMLWGIVGMFIMVAAFSILHILANTTGSLLGGSVDLKGY